MFQIMQCPCGRTVQQPSNTGRSSAVQQFISVQFSSSSTLASPSRVLTAIWFCWYGGLFFFWMISTVAASEEGGKDGCKIDISLRLTVRVWQSILLSFTFFLSFLRTTASAVGGRAVNKASEPPPPPPHPHNYRFPRCVRGREGCSHF